MQRISTDRLRRYPRPLQGGVQVLSRSGRGGGGSMVDQYRNMMNRANRKNEERYGQILSGYDNLHGRVMGDMAQVGIQERADIDRSYRNMGSDVYQRLVNRGFANSTIPATMQMGVERERLSARGRLASDLAQQRARYDTGITEGKLGVMERRSDVGPDYNQLAQLTQGLGRAGYGAGGAGMRPIGISGNPYQQFMGQNMAMMQAANAGAFGGWNRYAPIRANQRARANRLRRAQGQTTNAYNDAANLSRFQGIA